MADTMSEDDVAPYLMNAAKQRCTKGHEFEVWEPWLYIDGEGYCMVCLKEKLEELGIGHTVKKESSGG